MYIIRGNYRNTIRSIVFVFTVSSVVNLSHCVLFAKVAFNNFIVEYGLFVSSLVITLIFVKDRNYTVHPIIVGNNKMLLATKIVASAWLLAVLSSIFTEWKRIDMGELMRYTLILLFFLIISQDAKAILLETRRK